MSTDAESGNDIERVALPDPILPPALAYELGEDARPEGRMLPGDRFGWCCGCQESHELRLTERTPGPKPAPPRWVRSLSRETP